MCLECYYYLVTTMSIMRLSILLLTLMTATIFAYPLPNEKLAASKHTKTTSSKSSVKPPAITAQMPSAQKPHLEPVLPGETFYFTPYAKQHDLDTQVPL
jgi:hypothetical protein